MKYVILIHSNPQPWGHPTAQFLPEHQDLLARNLNLCTVAEGVETAEQADELQRLGATFLQGFSLAEPMTGGRAADWFATHGRTAP